MADIIEERERFLLDRKTHIQYDRAISMGKRLLDPVIEDIEEQPTPLYFHHYRQLNFFLDRAAFLVASYIQVRGFKALPIPASQTIDWKNQKGHLSHKKIGELAGLGWIGRNNLLVNPKWGSRFRLVTVLTDMPLEADVPLEDDCGECRRCLPVCPAKAIPTGPPSYDPVNECNAGNFLAWHVNHKLCYRYWAEVGTNCGLCIAHCPLDKHHVRQKPFWK